jgi:hypothetical protein
MFRTDALANHLARLQHGVFSRSQLTRRRVDPSAIERRVRSGRWLRLAPGVYGLPSHEGTWHRQLWVAHLANPGSVIGMSSAAVLHGMEGFQKGPVQLVLPPDANARCGVARIHRFDGVRTSTVQGLPTTTIAQTAADLCSTIWGPRLEGALDRLLLAGRVTIAELEERVRFYEASRRRGYPLFRELVRERTDSAWRPSESALEDKLRALLRRLPSRPHVDWQPNLPWRPSTGERLDALLPDHDILLEADGRTWHARVQDFDTDRWRDNEAVAHGLLPMRFTWLHLTQRGPACRDLIEQAIADRRRVRAA